MPVFIRPLGTGALKFVTIAAVAGVVWCLHSAMLRRPSPLASDDSIIREPFRVEVTGSDGRWRVVYPDLPVQSTATKSDDSARQIHVPQTARVVLILRSEDFIYTLAIPAYDVKGIAVPDVEFSLPFCATETGKFEFHGAEMCGAPRSELDGQLCVEPPDRFSKWLDASCPDAAD